MAVASPSVSGVGSHNDFLHISICHPGEKSSRIRMSSGANVVQRRDHAVEHMI